MVQYISMVTNQASSGCFLPPNNAMFSKSANFAVFQGFQAPFLGLDAIAREETDTTTWRWSVKLHELIMPTKPTKVGRTLKTRYVLLWRKQARL